jgi:transcriptional regulator with XRE-family HTH domain
MNEQITMALDTHNDLESRRRRDLGEFLRAKRALLKPSDFGLPTSGRRRAPGLRREEVAQISGIGVTWYTWLEQGRDIRVSDDLLRRLTRVLRLSPHEATYLCSLAGRHLTVPPHTDLRLPEGVQGVLDGYSLGPAFVLDLVGNVLAFNRIGDFIYRFTDYDGPRRENHLWRLFMDPYRMQLHVDWPDFARYVVGLMRGVFPIHSDDSDFHQLVEDLHNSSPQFRAMWEKSAQQGATSLAPSRVHFQVPELGCLNFLSVRFEVPTNDARAFFLSPIDQRTTEVMLHLGESLSNTNSAILAAPSADPSAGQGKIRPRN